MRNKTRVRYTSPKTGVRALGVIVARHDTRRGSWYEVLLDDGRVMRARISSLEGI